MQQIEEKVKIDLESAVLSNGKIKAETNVPQVQRGSHFCVDQTQNQATILDKTVEKVAYLGAFFLNFVADRFFPPPLPLEAVLLGLQKKAGSLSICRKQL